MPIPRPLHRVKARNSSASNPQVNPAISLTADPPAGRNACLTHSPILQPVNIV